MQKKRLFAVLAVTGTLVLGAAEPPVRKTPMGTAEKIATVRLIAALQPGKAMRDWMTAGAFARWQSAYGMLTGSGGESSMMADFFAQAILFRGTQNAQSGIWMLYNPLQDNAMILQTDNTERIPRIEDFAFLTGSAFRGETLNKNERPQAIVPTKGALDAVLLGNVAATAARFHQEFPEKVEAVTLAKYRKIVSAADAVSANIALRMAMLERFTRPDAKADADKAGEIALLLWKGDAAALQGYFDAPEGSDAVARYAALPARIRSSMLPAVYYKTKEASLLGFSSAAKPDLLILVRLAASGKPFFVFLPMSEEFAAAMQTEKK
jgi:hypothetical protein